MAEKDVKIVFNNVADLAMLSDLFTERLEDSLGSVLEGGTGRDCVGKLFLEMVCALYACPRARALTFRMRDLDPPLGTTVQKIHRRTLNCSQTPE